MLMLPRMTLQQLHIFLFLLTGGPAIIETHSSLLKAFHPRISLPLFLVLVAFLWLAEPAGEFGSRWRGEVQGNVAGNL